MQKRLQSISPKGKLSPSREIDFTFDSPTSTHREHPELKSVRFPRLMMHSWAMAEDADFPSELEAKNINRAELRDCLREAAK